MDDPRAELIRTAKALLDGSIEMLIGIRRIDDLRFSVADEEDPIFLSIRGIASEADSLPENSLLATYHERHREAVAEEIRKFESYYRSDVNDACAAILRKFGDKS